MITFRLVASGIKEGDPYVANYLCGWLASPPNGEAAKQRVGSCFWVLTEDLTVKFSDLVAVSRTRPAFHEYGGSLLKLHSDESDDCICYAVLGRYRGCCVV